MNITGKEAAHMLDIVLAKVFAEKPKEAHIIREMTDFYQVPVRWMKDIKQGKDYITPEGEITSLKRYSEKRFTSSYSVLLAQSATR